MELWESEEKGVHPRAKEKQAKCCRENVCSLTRAVERLNLWVVRGTTGPLTRLCHRNGSCELRKRGSVCYLEKSKSFMAAANAARGARVMPVVLA